jgi:hypothetical protein
MDINEDSKDFLNFFNKLPNDITFFFSSMNYLHITLKNLTLYGLTPKGPRGVFLQKRSKSAISSSRSPNEIFFTFYSFLTI